MEDGVKYRDADLPLTQDERDGDAESLDEALTESLDRVTLSEHEAAAERLRLIAEHDARGAWKRDGARSMADWLCARYGPAKSTALEWVRVAGALRGLPRIAGAYASGRMSFDQLRAVTHLATPDDDRTWAEQGCRWRPGSLWQEVKRRRRLERGVVEEVRAARSFRLWRDPVLPMIHLEGTVPAEEGAAAEVALLRASKDIPRDPEAQDPEAARMADALIALLTRGAGQGIPRAGSEPSRAGDAAHRCTPMLVVHADARVLTREDGGETPALAETGAGDRLPSDAVRRIACDARIDWVLERDGSPVRIGTQGRTVPDRLKRTVLWRDKGCRFPGCEARRYIDAHHIVHWADGGPTTLDNLVILCDAHHRVIHDGGWRISGHPGRDLRFHDPSGRPLRMHPEPLARRSAAAPLRM